MPREAEPSLNERQFVIEALNQKLRLDGRKFDNYRPLELEFGDEYGVATVKLGRTKYKIAPYLPSTPSLTAAESSPKPPPKSQSLTPTGPPTAYSPSTQSSAP
jgi:hypothetical protein